MCMANTKPPVDNVETLSYVLEKGKQTGIHVLSVAAVTKGMQGKELTDFAELKKAKAAGLSDDENTIKDSPPHVRSFLKKERKKKDFAVSLHEKILTLYSRLGSTKEMFLTHLGSEEPWRFPNI